jgi:hypothetical protein
MSSAKVIWLEKVLWKVNVKAALNTLPPVPFIGDECSTAAQRCKCKPKDGLNARKTEEHPGSIKGEKGVAWISRQGR